MVGAGPADGPAGIAIETMTGVATATGTDATAGVGTMRGGWAIGVPATMGRGATITGAGWATGAAAAIGAGR